MNVDNTTAVGTSLETGAARLGRPGAHNRAGHFLAVTALIGGAGVFLAGPATAAGATGHKAASAYAELRAAHFAPTMPGVDLYLGSFTGTTSKQWLSGVRYGAVSPYRQIKTGLYTVSVRKHGAAASSPAVLSWTLDARAGKAYTVAGVGAGAKVRGIVLADDLSTPPAGDGRVRVIQAASRAASLTVQAVSGPTIIKNARFATASRYRDVPAGTWNLAAASDADSAVKTSATVQVVAGQSLSVLVLDAADGGITVRSLLDSAAPSAMPKGPVDAGGGGTATSFVSGGGAGWHPVSWLVALLTAGVAGTGLRSARNRRSQQRPLRDRSESIAA